MSESSDVRAALCSLLLPGLGQLLQHRYRQAAAAALCTVALVSASLMLGRVSGRAAEVFFFMVLALPWWALQAYDAYLGASADSSSWQADVPYRMAARPRYPFSRGLLADQCVERHDHHPREFRLSAALLLHQAGWHSGISDQSHLPRAPPGSRIRLRTAAPAGRSSSISSMPPTGLRTAWSISPALARVGSETRSLPPSSSRRSTSSGVGTFC